MSETIEGALCRLLNLEPEKLRARIPTMDGPKLRFEGRDLALSDPVPLLGNRDGILRLGMHVYLVSGDWKRITQLTIGD